MKHNIPLVKLEHPIQKGYKKFFVLRSDIANRRDADDFKRILKVINNTVYCKNPDFKALKFHNKQQEDIPHTLGHIPEKQWEKLNWPPHFKKWFGFSTKIKPGYGGTHYEIKGYWFAFDYMFAAKVEPHFATHCRPVDPKIEREIAEINQYFEANNGWARLNHLQGHASYHWHDPRREDYLNDIQLREEMKEFDTNYLDPP